MAHPVVFRYISYSTTLAEHDVHRLRRCPAFGRAKTCLFLSVLVMSITQQQGGHMTMARLTSGHGKNVQTWSNKKMPRKFWIQIFLPYVEIIRRHAMMATLSQPITNTLIPWDQQPIVSLYSWSLKEICPELCWPCCQTLLDPGPGELNSWLVLTEPKGSEGGRGRGGHSYHSSSRSATLNVVLSGSHKKSGLDSQKVTYFIHISLLDLV